MGLRILCSEQVRSNGCKNRGVRVRMDGISLIIRWNLPPATLAIAITPPVAIAVLVAPVTVALKKDTHRVRRSESSIVWLGLTFDKR